jgi:hypothetical protein
MQLSELARLARRTRGRLQSINRGCDVFLTDPENRYLGRLCVWTRCGPYIRASCDAQHCGQRTFLHDDFDDIRLPRAVIIEPPVELWPQLIIRRAIPPDLSQLLDRLSPMLLVPNPSKGIPNGM